MNIFQRSINFLRSTVSSEKRSSVGIKNTEAWNYIFPEWGLGVTHPNVNVATATRLSVVFTCLNVLGETRGSLPCEVKQNTSKGRVTVWEHPIYRLVHDRPNPYMTAFDFWSTIEKLKKAWGNAYAEIERDGKGNPIALWIRNPQFMVYSVLSDGERYYTYEGRTIRNTDMLHFKNFSMDGYTGISTIRQNALSIGMGLKLKEYNSKIIGDRPYGFLTTETRPKDLTSKDNMGKMWSKKQDVVTTIQPTGVSPDKVTVGNIMQIPILYGGVKFEQLSLPADDVAYIESTNLTNKDIYGIFRMPPTFGQDWENTPYNGAEQQDLIFAKYTLASVRGDEQELTEKLFPEANKHIADSFYIKFNMKGLLSGDHASRKDFYTALFNIGAMNANEIRECEDQPHYEGGDDYYVQGALVPVKLIGEFIQSKITQAKNKGQNKASIAAETKAFVMGELREKMKAKLNGHYKEVEEFLR